MGNAWKVSKRIRRLRRKYLSVYEEYGNLRYTMSSPNVRKVFKRIWRIRGKNLCVHGEDTKRLLAYSPYTPRDLRFIHYMGQIITIYAPVIFMYRRPTLYPLEIAVDFLKSL
jgi:hypothetical protein